MGRCGGAAVRSVWVGFRVLVLGLGLVGSGLGGRVAFGPVFVSVCSLGLALYNQYDISTLIAHVLGIAQGLLN